MHEEPRPGPKTQPKSPTHDALYLPDNDVFTRSSLERAEARRENPSIHNVIDPPRRPIGRSGGNLSFRDRARVPVFLGGVLGGARRDRTDDLMLAKHALYQLSYDPSFKRRPAWLGAPHKQGRCRSLSVRPRCHTKCGGPRQTRTADLTLIRRVL